MQALAIGSGFPGREHERADVQRVQRIVGTADDGWYGNNTDRRVREYCNLFGLRYPGKVDAALWEQVLDTISPNPIAWGAKVSPDFRQKVREIARGLMTHPDYLMCAMAFESAETFRPDIRNAAGSGATGLIQFMPATARNMGTTTEALAALSAEAQLDWVYRYLLPYRGRLGTLEDVYMSILWPAAVGQPMGFVIIRQHMGKTYSQNRGLDFDRNGEITKLEAASAVYRKVYRGNLNLA